MASVVAAVETPLDTALELVAKGFPVLPTKRKEPLTVHGVKDATTDESQIKAWWRKWPDAVPAIPTGEITGMWALDVDRPKEEGDKDGYDTLRELVAQHGPLSHTLMQMTPSDGCHRFYKLPSDGKGIPNRVKFAPGLDTRSSGTYVCYYGFAGEIEVADPDDWLVEKIRKPQKDKPQREQSNFPPPRLSGSWRDIPYVRKAVEDELARLASAPRGERNTTTNDVGFALGQWVGGGFLGQGEAQDMLLAGASQNGLVHDDGMASVLKTIESGLTAGMQKPRAVPENRREDYAEHVLEASLPHDSTADTEPKTGEEKKKAHTLDIDPEASLAIRFILEYPPAYSWIWKGSLLPGDLGILSGAPGVGKSTTALYMAAGSAAGTPILGGWIPTNKYRCAYISAEDSEDVLQRRTYHIMRSLGLTEPEMMEAASRMHVVPVSGDVSFIRNGTMTSAFRAFKVSVAKLGAQIYFLDNLARFAGCDENDNAAMTRFCAEIEAVCKEFSCNIIILHHTNKAAGDCLNDPKALDAALNQTSIRGASAIAGCARWVLSMASLGVDLAGKTFGRDADGKTPGTYVAARVSKKNAGAPEGRHYYKRGEHGLLHKVEPAKNPKEDADAADITKIIEEVVRRERAGEKPLSKITGVADLLMCGSDKARRLSDLAIEQHLLGTVSLTGKGGGEGLCTGVLVDDEISTKHWMDNYDR